MKIKKVEAQNQILRNYIKAKGLDKEIEKNTEKVKNKNIDKQIFKDLKFTIIYILGSILLLAIIKFLNLDLFLNKLF